MLVEGFIFVCGVVEGGGGQACRNCGRPVTICAVPLVLAFCLFGCLSLALSNNSGEVLLPIRVSAAATTAAQESAGRREHRGQSLRGKYSTVRCSIVVQHVTEEDRSGLWQGAWRVVFGVIL